MEIPNSLAERFVTRGAILHSTIFKNIDHGKFFVVIGVSSEYVAGFFFINSNINRYLVNKQEQLNMQYGIKKSDYGFLKHNSFISASSLLTMSISELTDTIQNGTTNYIDNLREEHLRELLEAARKSKLFSKREKKEYFY